MGGAGGSGGRFDASVPNFPGDGLEATPEEDISDREVPQLPSDEFVDSVIDVAEEINPGQGRPRTGDASSPDAAGLDAGPDGST